MQTSTLIIFPKQLQREHSSFKFLFQFLSFLISIKKKILQSNLGGELAWRQIEFDGINELLKESIAAQHEQIYVEQFFGNSLAITEVYTILLFKYVKIVD